MPNRILKESIRESYSLHQLSDKAEIMFYRLLTYADDFGLFKADPTLVNKAMFPLCSYNDEDIMQWLQELGDAEIVGFYIGDDKKPYGKFCTWEQHQQQRAKRSKHPEPNGNLCNSYYTTHELWLSSANICYPLQSSDNGPKTYVPVIQSNPIQSEKESNPVKDIFNFWNSQNIKNHKSLNGKTRDIINKALKDYDFETLCVAISTYGEIIHGSDYYFDYRWGLGEFLKRGIEKFDNPEIARKNFKKKKETQPESTETEEKESQFMWAKCVTCGEFKQVFTSYQSIIDAGKPNIKCNKCKEFRVFANLTEVELMEHLGD